jgi:hypothetical protein
MDKESIKGMVIPPGIIHCWTRNPPEEWLFRQELPTNRRGIDQRNGYSARNYPLMEAESTRGMVIPPGITH